MEAKQPEALTLKSNLIWNSVGNFIYLISQWLFTYLVTIALGFEGAGIYSLAVSICTTFYTISAYGMRNYQASDISHEYADSTYVESRYLTSLIALVGCALFSLLTGYAWQTLYCIALYMLFKLTESVSDVYQGVVQLRMRMDYVGKSFIAKGVLELATFGSCLFISRDLTLSLGVLFLTSLLVVACYDARRAHLFYRPQAEPLKLVLSLLKACLPVAVYGLLFTAAGQIPRIVLESMLGSTMLGYYSSIAMPVTIIQVSANFIFAPLATPLAEAYTTGDMKAFSSMIKKVVISIVAIAVAGVAGFAVLGEWFYTLLFGDAIAPYVGLSIPLVLSCALVAACWFLATVVMVLRRLRGLVISSVLICAIAIAGSVPCIDLFGPNGATLVYIAGLVAFIVCNVALLRRSAT